MKEPSKNYCLLDIIQHTTWKQVKRALEYHYPKDTNDYKKLYSQLKKYPRIKQRNKGEYIQIRANQFYDTEDRWISIHTNKYSMSFRPWKELANVPIEKETLERILVEEIVAHFIWEITFYGSESEMNKTYKEMTSKIDEIDMLEMTNSL